MIAHDVYHDPHVLPVCGIDQMHQVLLTAEVLVNSTDVLGPVSVVSTWGVFHNR